MKLSLASKHVEELSKKSNLTLYSDETSKFGKSYEVFAVTDEQKNSYLLGLREMNCKSSQTVLDTFKEILNDFNDLNGDHQVGFKLMAAIKNTMSDRANTEKKFQTLLEEYRTNILSKIIDGWQFLSDEEKDAYSRMNNFFCSLHLLVNFADVCGEALKKFESLYAKDNPIQIEDTDDSDLSFSSSESGTIRLLRTASKSFGRGVDEKNGVYRQFTTYLQLKKDDRVKFVRFTHNRFNIFFLLGHVTYYHRENIKYFLESVHGCTNRLLSSVFRDICNPLYIAGSRALGIIFKIITGPLWRDIECKSHIFDINDKINALHSFLAEAKDDCSEVLAGNFFPFPDVHINQENIVMAELFRTHESDGMTVQILQVLFSCMLTLLDRQAADHLPGGKYFTKPEDIAIESSSALKHNKLPEFLFGQLDFLLKYRPNATLLCNETYLLYSHNKTDEWLQSLDDSTRIKLINESKKEGKNIRLKFHERLKTIEEKRVETLKLKEKEIFEKKKRLLRKKETFTNDILFFGLWQSREDIKLRLQEIHSIAEKKKALKSQLNFRKNVLLQKTTDKSLFLFSSKKKQKTVAELTEQLCQLVDQSKSVETVETSSSSKIPLLVGKNIKHKFEEGSFSGKVISVVPGFAKWYNVVYANDPAVYVYQLQEDYCNGNLEIVVGWYTDVLALLLLSSV